MRPTQKRAKWLSFVMWLCRFYTNDTVRIRRAIAIKIVIGRERDEGRTACTLAYASGVTIAAWRRTS